MSGPGVVEQYWSGVASQLQVEAEVFSQLVQHNGESGRANEIALARLIGNLLPARYEVGTGVIIDSLGNRSKQTDLIVFDRGAQPQLLSQSTQLLFPVETVRMAIEVKTTLSSAEIGDTARKVRAVNELRTTNGRTPPVALFAYMAAGAAATRAVDIDKLDELSRPAATCVLNPGMVTNPVDPTRMGLVPRHCMDDSGVRMGEAWERSKESGWVVRGSTRYPVSRISSNAREKYVFEPGRALLLFAARILELLSPEDPVWLDHYLTDRAKEVVMVGGGKAAINRAPDHAQ